ncbi:glycoside hydrolase family 16 protein [Frondihabitans cladoniiphilus]|uniref:Glycoside hydrolase family 16 protein n=1 Tax=Frondihabitans cladoniiphilus TaxID=715785 RepID=A0ABP8W4P8_9MICO
MLRPTRFRPRSVAIASLVGLTVLLAACSSSAPAPSTTTTTPKAGAVLFQDDFSGAKGTAVNGSHWSNDVSGTGNGNDELEYNTAGTANAALDGDGHLAITAKKGSGGHTCWYGTCAYTSARLVTAGKFQTQYGLVEARMKLPAGQGIWSAFWMLGADVDTNPWPGAGEIDIMENIGSESGTVHGTLHGPGYSSGATTTDTYSLPDGEALSDAFHTFAIDWTEDKVEFLVDGTVYQTRTPADVEGSTWVFDKPFTLLLDLAVGGTFPGNPDSSTVLPATLLVDWVKVVRN